MMNGARQQVVILVFKGHITKSKQMRVVFGTTVMSFPGGIYVPSLPKLTLVSIFLIFLLVRPL
jgi:hypothetical protein